jgi:TonB family protein
MKKLIYTSLIAMLGLASCLNEAKKNGADTTINSAETPPTIPPPAPEEEKVVDLTTLETPPKYPGGIPDFYKFIGNNLKYPEAALKNKVEGKVLTTFIIEKDGSISDIKVEKKLGSGTDEEAIRVLKLAKKWEPGMVNGKPVRVKYNIPINFSILEKN